MATQVRTLQSIDPSTGELIEEFVPMSAAEVDDAVGAAAAVDVEGANAEGR